MILYCFSYVLFLLFFPLKFVFSSPDDLSCIQIVCNFEQQNLCGYENFQPDANDGQSMPTKQWQLTQGLQKNLATGVRKPGEGSFYASTYLMKNDTAILSSQGYLMTNSIRFLFPLTDDRVIRFKYYKVSDNMLLKGCCDSTANCPFVTERTAKITDFNSWKTASFICKSGTEKILFFAVNEGRNEGGIGLDDIKLLYPNSADPSDAQDSVCKTNSQGELMSDLLQNFTENGSDLASSGTGNRTVLSILSSMRKKSSLSNDSNLVLDDGNLNQVNTASEITVSTTASTDTTDEIFVVIIPGDSEKSKSSSADKNDFHKTVLKDSSVLSSRLYLTSNDTVPRKTDNQNTFSKTLEVSGLDVVSLPSGTAVGQQTDEYHD